MAFSLKSTSSLLSRYPLLSGLALQPQSLSLSPLRTYATAPSPPQAATVSVQSSSSSSRSTQKPSNHILPWHEYFTARKKRKRYDLGGSVFTAATAASGAWNGLSSLDIDKMMSGELILGMDPLMFLGLATVGITFIGWVVGPTIGTAVFFLFRGREFKRVTIQRDADFFQRIASRRPSAEGSSASNIIPDWYGEKVVDIPTYRTWLRRQRQFVKKREHAPKK